MATSWCDESSQHLGATNLDGGVGKSRSKTPSTTSLVAPRHMASGSAAEDDLACFSSDVTKCVELWRRHRERSKSGREAWARRDHRLSGATWCRCFKPSAAAVKQSGAAVLPVRCLASAGQASDVEASRGWRRCFSACWRHHRGAREAESSRQRDQGMKVARLSTVRFHNLIRPKTAH